MDVRRVQFGDSPSKRSRDIRAARFMVDDDDDERRRTDGPSGMIMQISSKR